MRDDKLDPVCNPDGWPQADLELYESWLEKHRGDCPSTLDQMLVFLNEIGLPQSRGVHVRIEWTEPRTLLCPSKVLMVRSEADFVDQFREWAAQRFERLTDRGVFRSVGSVDDLDGLKFNTMEFSVHVSFHGWPRREERWPADESEPQVVFTSESTEWRQSEDGQHE